MKVLGIWVLLTVAGTALLVLNVCNATTNGFSGLGSENMGMTKTTRSGKMKEEAKPGFKDNGEASHVNLEDYRPYDPAPSSKAWIRPGPIQHGTPLMPFIPKPSPPGHPKLADSP